MDKYDELMIALIGINYIIKDLEEQINGAEMCCMGDMRRKINLLKEISDGYKKELAEKAIEVFGL